MLKFNNEKNKQKRLTRFDRNEIQSLKRKRYAQKEIASRIGVTQGAISYELNKKSRKNRLYDSAYAEHKTSVLRRHSRVRGNTIVENRELQKTIDDYLFDDQSPELLSGRIRRHHRNIPYVSGRTIRKYIDSPYGRRIEAHRNKLHRKRRGKRRTKKRIADKRMIDKRPKYIKGRKRIGDAEGDFIVSGKTGAGMLFVCADRKSRATFLEKIFPVSIKCVENAIGRIKKRFSELKTMTFDNDLLFIHHKRLEKKFNIKIYFCHNHSPWEKPLVENRNKIIRRYIPKGSDISLYTRNSIRKLEEKLQRRIMKCLNYKLPKEILEEHRKRKKKP